MNLSEGDLRKRDRRKRPGKTRRQPVLPQTAAVLRTCTDDYSADVSLPPQVAEYDDLAKSHASSTPADTTASQADL
jgi:hypothetical protein